MWPWKRRAKRPSGTTSAALMRARDVERRYADQLMSAPGVVSVGLGRTRDGTITIVVGLEREDDDALDALPASLEGVRIVTQVLGSFSAKEP